MTTHEERAQQLLAEVYRAQRNGDSSVPLIVNALNEEFNLGLQAGSRLALLIEKAAREVVAAEDAMASTVNADSATAMDADRRYDAAWAALRGALSPG